MKTKQEIQNQLTKEFGENVNNVDNLITWMQKHYHPKIFTSIKDYAKTSYFKIKGYISIEDYTDDYITEADGYIIILLDDYRDFEGALETDCVHEDIVIGFNKETKEILKFYYNGYYNDDLLKLVESFIDLNGFVK